MSNLFYQKWLDSNVKYSSKKSGETMSFVAYVLFWFMAVPMFQAVWVFGIFFKLPLYYFIFPVFIDTLLIFLGYILRNQYLAAKALNQDSLVERARGMGYLKKSIKAEVIFTILILLVLGVLILSDVFVFPASHLLVN